MSSSNVDYILDHRQIILAAYQAAEKSPSATWKILIGENGTLPGVAEIMKYDSFRTYLSLLESLGKRLDPGNVSEMIEKQISDMENRIVARIDDRISSLEKKLDAVLEKQNCVSFSVKDDDCVACVDDTQTTQKTTQDDTQITQRLDSIEDSIESSKVWWSEIERHVRTLSEIPKLEEVEKKIVILDRQIGELAKETDASINMARGLENKVESLERKATEIIGKRLVPAAEYDDLRSKHENAKNIIKTMKPAELPFPQQQQDTQLIDVRKKKGMSQQQLADFLGVSRNSIANWESGRSKTPPDVIGRMNDERGVEILPSVKLG